MSDPTTTPDADDTSVAVHPAQFGGLPEGAGLGPPSEVITLRDVPVTVGVELGRVDVPIGELLRMREGSVVELDREVAEPVDVRVNGRLLARGEVVVVDGRFGVRLTELVGGAARAAVGAATSETPAAPSGEDEA